MTDPTTPAAPKRVGRPAKHQNAAARQAAYRSRHNLVNVELDRDLVDVLDDYIASSGEALTRSTALEKLLRAALIP